MTDTKTIPGLAVGSLENKSALSLKATFYWGLLLATVLPFLLVPLATAYKSDTQSMLMTVALLNFLGGTGHVGLTYYYYSQNDFKQFFRATPMRYYVVPFLVVSGTALAFALGTLAVKAYVLLFYFVWQTYHYQRQNHGILAFVSRATQTGQVTWQEKTALELSAFAGILALVRIYELQNNTFMEPWAIFLYDVGRILMKWIVPIFLVWGLLRVRAPLKKVYPRFIALAIGSFFFIPSFLSKSPLQAVATYAWAHGLQYYVFMYFVSRADGSRERDFGLFRLMLACFAVGGLLFLMGDRLFWGRFAEPIFGAYLGFVMVHFLVDAGVWKMSEPFQGKYLKKAFSFLFT